MKVLFRKAAILIAFLSFWHLVAFCQNNKGVKPSKAENKPALANNIWAVVAGISDYQNPEIPDLQYAHVDATAFVNFLKSPAGGNLNSDHIKALINENATAGQFAAAMDWLIEKAKEGDQVIIYFSGHGDVERKTITQPGFLLCWDAPSKVYMGGGTFGLAYLQEVISTISSQSKAKVMVITDACHSGRLAGSEIGGAQATVSNLSKQFANEVKLMSCQANELSLEGPQWGNGRGVFSYYLIKGLTGLADENKDSQISLFEIERYLGDKVPASTAPKSQIPVAFGSKNTIIGFVDSASLAALKQEENVNSSNSNSALAAIKNSTESISISSVFDTYMKFKKALSDKHLLLPEEGSAYSFYLSLKDNPALTSEINSMKSELAAALQDEAQQAINKYLEADIREIASRWANDTKYEKFEMYLNKAAELLGSSHYLYDAIKAREHYYAGLNLRLKGVVDNNTEFYRRAISKEFKAISYDTNASYVYNELGYIYKLLKEPDSAFYYFNIANVISPKWTLPMVNYLNTSMENNRTIEAKNMIEKFVGIDSVSYLSNYNLAIYKMWLSNWEAAINLFNKALILMPDDRDALFNQSYAYYQMGDFDRVEKITQKLMDNNPGDLDLYIPLVCVKVKKADIQGALQMFERALANGFKNIKALESESDLSSFIKSKDYLSLKRKYKVN